MFQWALLGTLSEVLLFELLCKTDLWNIPWFRGLNKALCAMYFLEGAAIREKCLMSLSHPTSSPTHSHTSSHPVNSSLFWSHFSSWRRINCTSKRGSTPPHSDTCCDHRLCTFVLLHFMLLRLRECPTAICESVEKNVLGLRGTRGNQVFYWRCHWTFPVFKTLSITLNWMYLLQNNTFLALVYVS